MYVTLHSIIPGNAVNAPARQGFSDHSQMKNYLPSVSNFIAICDPPTDFKVGTITDTTASYSWTGIPGSTSYEIEYKDTSSDTWKLIIDQTVTNSLTLEYLSPGTRYDVRIRSRCKGDSSYWVSRQFTTTASTTNCPPPFDLKTWDIKDTEAKMSWSVKHDSLGIHMQYKQKNSDTWIPVAMYQKAKEFYLWGLNPGTEYEWRIQTECTLTQSDWVKFNFKTTGTSECRAPFDLRVFEIRDTSAVVGWGAWETGVSSYYYVEYKEASSSAWTPALPPYLIAHEIEYLKNLKPSTTYDWRVLVICNGDSSEWSTGNFKTLAGGSPPPPPEATVTVDFSFSSPACEPALYNFSNNSTARGTAITTLEWNFGDGEISNTDNPAHQYKKTGDYTVTLTVRDSSGRSYSKQRSITIKTVSPRFADAGKDLILCDETPVQLNASGGVSYTWKPCTGLDNCNIENPTVNPGLNDRYIVTITSADGCTDSDTVNITLINTNSKIYIPNAFTPNNDGLNDQFRPLVSLQGQVDAEWKLFNRFGNMVFSSNSSTAGWDGKYKGEIQPPGNYTYMITIKATGGCPARNMKGTVLLIR
jgi:gliding motility-associated-like protein